MGNRDEPILTETPRRFLKDNNNRKEENVFDAQKHWPIVGHSRAENDEQTPPNQNKTRALTVTISIIQGCKINDNKTNVTLFVSS